MDSRVQLLGKDYPNPTTLRAKGATTFFGSLPEDAVEFLRNNRIDDFGLPSGHTSGAVANWGTVFLFFQKTWVRIICILLILLIPLSRMYLGRHFLADILAGYALGFFILFIFHYLIYRNESIKNFIFKTECTRKLDVKTILFISYLIFIPLLLFFIHPFDRNLLASFLGINAGYCLVWIRGIPDDSGTVFQRALRVLIAVVFYFAFFFIFRTIAKLVMINETEMLESILSIIVSVIFIWGGTELCVALKLLKREKVSEKISVKDITK